jgi:hypothetical protein
MFSHSLASAADSLPPPFRSTEGVTPALELGFVPIDISSSGLQHKLTGQKVHTMPQIGRQSRTALTKARSSSQRRILQQSNPGADHEHSRHKSELGGKR